MPSGFKPRPHWPEASTHTNALALLFPSYPSNTFCKVLIVTVKLTEVAIKLIKLLCQEPGNKKCWRDKGWKYCELRRHVYEDLSEVTSFWCTKRNIGIDSLHCVNNNNNCNNNDDDDDDKSSALP